VRPNLTQEDSIVASGKQTSNEMASPPYRRGSVFKNERLIDFTDYAITVMRPWPDPRAWRKTSRGAWYPCRPSIWLSDEGFREGNDDAIAAETKPTPVERFMARAPERVRNIVGMYTKRQWHMLSLLARCPGSDDLAEHNPALAFALASSWVFRKKPVRQPLRSARSLVRKRQTKIQEWLGFPATKSVSKILKKIPPDSVSIEALLYLRDGLNDEEAMEYFRHTPIINRGIIYLVTRADLRRYITPQFLSELGEIRQTWPIYVMHPSLKRALQLKKLVNCIETIGRRPSSTLPRFRSFAELDHAQAEAAVEVMPWAREPKFPQPPIPESDTISAIRSARHLVWESTEMHHCIQSYAGNISMGDAYAYRVHEPERATVLIVRQDKSWTIQEMRTAANGLPDDETWHSVNAWLHGPLEELVEEEFCFLNYLEPDGENIG
jgi:hypothetical protein